MAKFGIDPKNTKQMMLIAAVIGAGVLYLYVNFLLLPQIAGVLKTSGKANNMRKEIKAAESDISKIDKLKRQVDASQGKIESYERMLPIEQEMPKLLQDLSTMARASNVKILGITPALPKDGSQAAGQIYQEKPIRISAKSGYHELGKFLSKLENSDRFMKVVEISIKQNNMTPKRHDVELLVHTYVLTRSR